MRFVSGLLIALALVSSGCARFQELLAEPPTPQPSSTAAIATPLPTSTPYLPISPTNSHPDCPVTPVVAGPPPSKDAAQFPAPFWSKSDDGQLWAASAGSLVYAGETSFAWSKPADAQLLLSGKRIDGDSPPFHAVLPESAGGESLVTTLIFPTSGCWSIQAQAGASTLEIILYVEPYLGPQGGECATVDDAARLADAILVARVTHTDDSKGYAWQTLQIQAVWKNPFQSDFPKSIALLQNLQLEPQLKTGNTYLLFLQYTPWLTVCSRATLAEINGQDVRLLSSEDALWTGTTLSEIQSEIKNIIEP